MPAGEDLPCLFMEQTLMEREDANVNGMVAAAKEIANAIVKRLQEMENAE